MAMKKIYFLLFSCISSHFLTAQESKVAASSNPNRLEVIEQFKKEQAEKNYYYQLNDELKSYFADNQIHLKCPKGQNYQTKSEFIDAVNNWLRLNQQLVIDSKKGVYLTK
jgi:hypothetical protein